ncbi:hypothetical protein TNIN_259651 [Trichonephila inaurata madagascariensis]|uniref:Uncharacterized protein n=1 Tax=Trichonephila inaurata madagascariensis TaxID=2747483 RepID=A0A8X6WXR8_9ARAC|nr:hypothetical protein TNIN_259651 [Trichonephila inaurata madagascariensis]
MNLSNSSKATEERGHCSLSTQIPGHCPFERGGGQISSVQFNEHLSLHCLSQWEWDISACPPLESECIPPQWPLVVRKEADEGQVPDCRYSLSSASVGTNPGGRGFDFCFNKTITKKICPASIRNS